MQNLKDTKIVWLFKNRSSRVAESAGLIRKSGSKPVSHGTENVGLGLHRFCDLQRKRIT